MAFNGNLSEFGVVALLQLPGTNHLSGKLVLERNGSRAEFFYNKGKLVHAELGDIVGEEALVMVIDWTDGDFTFDSNSTTDEVTIQKDIQNTLMWALKERDERKKLKEEEELAERELLAKRVAAEEQSARERSAMELAAQAQSAAEALASKLPSPVELPESLIENSSVIQIAYLINSSGQIVAESRAEADFSNNIKPILIAVMSFIRDYPQRSLGKTFIEDSEYTLAVTGLSEKLTTVIFVPHGTRMGILNIELGKFLKALQLSGLELLND